MENQDNKKLKVGERYLTRSGYSIRTITGIEGSTIRWADDFGTGQCQRATFFKNCSTLATPKDIEDYEAKVEQYKSNPPPIRRRGSVTRRRLTRSGDGDTEESV